MSGHRKNGAGGAHQRLSLPRGGGEAEGGAACAPGPLDVGAALAGRTLLITGATGFVGKVALTLLLDRYPEIGKVFVLVRPGTGGSAEARFFEKVAASRPFDPLRQRHGDGFDAFLREKCVPLAGDVSDPLLGIPEEDLARLRGLDAVVNCAGLVDFDPSLELALGVNVRGPRNAVELCRRTGAALLHVSTCFVAGNRDGVVYEDEELQGYFPRREGVVGRPKEEPLDGADFDLDAEIADCERRLAEVRERAEDRVQQSIFRDRALERLALDGRPGDEKALRLAMAREKRVWISQRLVDVGMERARHWGWPNTYTYTKSLGEQAIAACLRRPEGDGIHWSIVRPSIVESALRYPFPGWNEGFTTSAPLTFLALKGHRGFPAAEKAILDVVPVDLVAAATLAATAELVERNASKAPPAGRIYHLASGDTNPLWARRAVELTALYRRRHFREREAGNATWNKLLSRIEPYSVTRTQYEAFGAPAVQALSKLARRFLDEATPRWGAPRLSALAERARRELDELDDRLGKLMKLWDLFLPFVWENKYVFRCAHIRELYERLTPADRERIPWDPERLDWRRYWLGVHMQGLEEWVFPGLEEQSGKRVHAPRAHRDLLELFESSCEQWKRRTALRMEGERKDRLTYGELRHMAGAVAGWLAGAGVAKGDRVVLASENRPEWAVAYFGILRAGAAAVPVDPQLSAPELVNLWKTAGARIAIVSDDTAQRHPELAPLAAAAVPDARVAPFAEVLRGGAPPPPPRVSGDDLASLIFTSGTTGTPKGVMLSHRNFASLVGKLSGIFELGPGDGLLSVLPLHHTFEFTAGLLVPLARGAEIEYLDELTADRLSEALGAGRVTAMIGVPALWSLLHRRITQELAAKPGIVEGAFKALMKGNAALRDSALAVNLGKLLFWPVHRKFGGRLRLLVSGGSALDPEVQKAFRELGFDLYEGYGLTEAAPVLAVSKPGGDASPGSVGPALPGVEIRIESPDANGVGEVLARGPNVMLGYWRGGAEPGVDPELTGEAVEDGWLRTGDLGKLDASGNLTLVGRKKDVIIDANGKNVYPDEVEDAYRDPDLVKELSVVGLPDGAKGEKVAMLLVPDWRDRDRGEVREKIDAHVRSVSAKLPFPKRVKVWHLVDGDLPKTATRKVKRPLVREELLRIEALAQKGRKARAEAQARTAGDGWLLDLVAEVSRRPRAEIGPETRLQADLGFDSLMITELTAALEEVGVPASLADHLQGIQTVGELARAVAGAAGRVGREPEPAASADDAGRSGEEEIHVPALVAKLGRKVLEAGQRALYEVVYETKVTGAAFVPHDRNFLVVANHASHLDMGLVKVALGEEGARVSALAARDYFFDTPLKRAYFENFTNLIPMEREGSLRTSLRAAAEALRRGYHLLIFPEGTRSRDGSMGRFYPTAGYLALHCGVDVLPAYLAGTHEALPPGKTLPRKNPLEVRFGPPIAVAELRRRTEGLSRSEAYRAATAVMEEAVKALRDGKVPDVSAPAPGASPTSISTPTAIARPTSTSTSTSTPTPTATPTSAPTATADARPAGLSLKRPEDE
jgi:long-chain acyl-CoA synthetase